MDKLEIYKSDNYVLRDAFDQSVMNIHILNKQKGYKSYVVCSCEPGDGATTVSINLAAALADSGWKTVLIDGDMRKKNKYKRLNQEVTLGLSDFLMNKTDIMSIIYETTTVNLSYIPCGELIDNPVRLLCSNKMIEVKTWLEKEFDYVVYDMPAVNAAMDAKVMAINSDAVIIVSSLGGTSKKGLVEAANTLSEENINLIGTIVNKIGMNQYSEINQEYDYFHNERYLKNNEIINKTKNDA